MKTLPLSFYQRSTKQIAKDLLGKILVRKYKGKEYHARIVETEAYLGVKDKACHSFKDKRTPRTESMYLEGGHAYIYLIYGMYHCLNVVTRSTKHPEAVLIRAAEPLIGFKDCNKRLLAGPGKLCREMKITKAQNGIHLSSKQLMIIDDSFKVKSSKITTCSRIGINYAEEHKELPLRFYITNSPSVSCYFRK